MKTRFHFPFRATLAAAVAAFALSGLPGRAGEDVAVADLPKEVSAAIEKRFPGSKLISAEKEAKKGETHYEVKVQSGDVRQEIDLKADGTILKVDPED